MARVRELWPKTTIGMPNSSGPSFSSECVLTLPLIMLATSATEWKVEHGGEQIMRRRPHGGYDLVCRYL